MTVPGHPEYGSGPPDLEGPDVTGLFGTPPPVRSFMSSFLQGESSNLFEPRPAESQVQRDQGENNRPSAIKIRRTARRRNVSRASRRRARTRGRTRRRTRSTTSRNPRSHSVGPMNGPDPRSITADLTRARSVSAAQSLDRRVPYDLVTRVMSGSESEGQNHSRSPEMCRATDKNNLPESRTRSLGL